MQHTPKLHIFIGQHNHFFTLRESYLHTYYVGRVNPNPVYEVRYGHIKNLSQNWEEAVEKAKEASKQYGVPLHVRDSEIEQLEEIKRISAEEREQQARLALEEYRKAEEEALARRLKWWKIWIYETTNTLSGITIFDFDVDQFVSTGGNPKTLIDNGMIIDNDTIRSTNIKNARMVGGSHDGKLLSDVPMSYLQWLVHSSGLCEIEDITFNKMAFVAQWIRDNIEVPEPVPSEWVGNIGDKIESTLTIDSVRTTNGYYGMSYMYKLTDDNGNQFVWFASRDALYGIVGKVNLKFTIKKHNEFSGVKQTIITRGKVV